MKLKTRCSLGHAGETEEVEVPQGVIGGIFPCPLCGNAARWTLPKVPLDNVKS